jgi:hypothetical protein
VVRLASGGRLEKGECRVKGDASTRTLKSHHAGANNKRLDKKTSQKNAGPNERNE